MKNKLQIALFTAAVLATGSVAGLTAGAADKTFSIGVTENDAEDWNVVAMANDDTVTTGACIRSKATTGSKVVGYLYRGGAVKVEEMGEEWSKVSSGNVSGYIKNEYLTYGTEAKGLAEHYGDYGVRASWDDVNVFSADSEASPIVGTAKDGDVYPVVNNNGHWMEIRTGEDETAYVSSEDVDLVIMVDTAYGADESSPKSAPVKTPAKTSGKTSPEASSQDTTSQVLSKTEASDLSEGTAGGTVVEEISEISHEAAAPVLEEAENDEWLSETFTYEDGDAANSGSAEEIYEYPAAEYEAVPEQDNSAASGQQTYAEDTAYDESFADLYTEDVTYDESYEDSYVDSTAYDESYDASYDEAYTDDTYTDDTYTDETGYDASYDETYTDETWTDDTAADASYDETYTDESYTDDTAYDESYDETYTDETWTDDTTYDSASEETYTDDTSYDTSTEETADTSSQSSSGSDLDLLAALIFCEAGNQPYDGQVAVGAVVMNRIASGSFPGSVSEVIYQSGQFTPAYSGALASALASGTGCYDAASEALAGSDPTGGALYFNTSHGSGTKIGDHWFY